MTLKLEEPHLSIQTNLSYSTDSTGAANAAYTLERPRLLLYDGGPGVRPTGEGLCINGGGRWLRWRLRETNLRFDCEVVLAAVGRDVLPDALLPVPYWFRGLTYGACWAARR